MGYDETDLRKLLEQLRQDSAQLIPQKGFFSPEFQSWHGAAIKILHDHFGENDILYKDFKNLQFEWPLEVLQSLHQSQIAFSDDPEAQIDASHKDAPTELRKTLQDAMKETLKGLSPAKRRQIGSLAPVLRAAEMQIFTHAQQRRFQSAMEQAYEILTTAIVFFDKHQK